LSFNKNIFIISVLVTLVYGCGVKGYPTAPQGTAIPSYVNKFVNPDSGSTYIPAKKKKTKKK
jgi:hypothetical protein